MNMLGFVRFGAVAVGMIASLTGFLACAAKATGVATQSSQVRLPFEDDFRAYTPQWRQVRGQWVVQDGALQQLRDDPREGNAINYAEPIIVADADVRTRVVMGGRLPQNLIPEDAELLRARRLVAGAGVVFRFADENNYYMFRLAGEDGAVLGRMKDGQWTDLVNPRAIDFLGPGGRISERETYELRVRVQGDRIQGWINDRAVVNVQDSTFATGKVGLVTFRSTASFDFIRVTEP